MKVGKIGTTTALGGVEIAWQLSPVGICHWQLLGPAALIALGDRDCRVEISSSIARVDTNHGDTEDTELRFSVFAVPRGCRA